MTTIISRKLNYKKIYLVGKQKVKKKSRMDKQTNQIIEQNFSDNEK